MKTIRANLWVYPLLSAAVALMGLPVSAEPSSITVNVTGVHSQSGSVMVCLWRQQDKDFPVCSSTAAMQYITAQSNNASATVTFQNVPAGEYAVSAFHDENQNGTLDRGFMGRPEEGIGFSNMTAQGGQGRPTFDKAKFTVNGQKSIALSLLYF
ncbi:MAG: DUF2141 domain-containing protein [Pegethrix bostrychoides GSE-TBD4-15B]|jgi:uncharacterized protein (DUF2141 family)|uniref:DUF2141 domain-containing protein n=1 Tax=Pegethrix bostrychoides GSE-TBD4-15B TaxID=2839662 RepID=A0A951P8E3_9CYAN|nr:DUF2141 domain-containing protein [Pegethrix bostrychoides GSE-TBD4-15B]